MDPTATQGAAGAEPIAAAGGTKHPLAILSDPATLDTFVNGRSERLWRWLTIGLVYLLYVWNCGSFGLWDPWETHYGEVSRTMLESYDWVNPWWGYKTKIGSEPVAGSWFYSKPIWIFWAEVSFLKLIGYSDWAFRLPIALIGASAVASIYLAVERALSRPYAFWAATVVGLSPFIYMVSRQAQTDMPFVATLTIGMSFFVAAVFGRHEKLSDAAFTRRVGLFLLFVLANLGPQLGIIASDLVDANAGAGLNGAAAWVATVQQNGIWHLWFYLPPALVVVGSVIWPIWRSRKQGWSAADKDAWLRRMLLLCFYLMLAQATYAKGLLGFMLPGAILFIWLFVSGHWKVLAKFELLRGIPLFLVAGLPWYVAMFCRHGRAYYDRFFIHDHFNRVGSGVHQIDQGTFEHFIEWLAYGLFPWTALVPMALVSVARPPRVLAAGVDSERGQAMRSFVFVWFAVAFAVFTVSSTKFHHYILPAAPALGMLVGFYLLDLERLGDRARRLQLLLATGLVLAVLVTLIDEPQSLRNMFTYKYDRPLPDNLPTDWNEVVKWRSDGEPLLAWRDQPFGKYVGETTAMLLQQTWLRYGTFVPWIGGAMAALVLVGLWRRGLSAMRVAMTAAALVLAVWTLNVYMPLLTPSWSQRYLFEAYYDDCTPLPQPEPIVEAYTPLIAHAGLDGLVRFFDSKPKRVCSEDIISWLITWRGETMYSNNEIRPINKEAEQFEPYMREMNKGRKLYVLMERGRRSGVEGKLRSTSKTLRDRGDANFATIRGWTCRLLSNDSAFFVVARCDPQHDGEPDTRDSAPASDERRGNARLPPTGAAARAMLRALPTAPTGKEPSGATAGQEPGQEPGEQPGQEPREQPGQERGSGAAPAGAPP